MQTRADRAQQSPWQISRYGAVTPTGTSDVINRPRIQSSPVRLTVAKLRPGSAGTTYTPDKPLAPRAVAAKRVRSRAAVSRRTGGARQGMPEMYDQPLFLQTLSRFALVLPTGCDLDVALTELTASVTAVLGLCGSGVMMGNDGRLRFMTTVTLPAADLERDHTRQRPCPCRNAYASGQVVRVSDVRQESGRWPEFSATASRLSLAGVAAIPMRLDNQIIGALNLYSSAPRAWSDESIAVAQVMADVATSYLVNASKLRQQQQLSEQLQEALESRVVIEQAKGIIAYQHSFTVDQAYQRMRAHARNNNASLRVVAEAVVAVGLHV
jgi:GAF domain-containing protein